MQITLKNVLNQVTRSALEWKKEKRKEEERKNRGKE
jgi:hypothetical protein